MTATKGIEMSNTTNHKYRSRWIASALGALALGGLSAASALALALADDHETECFSSAATLSEARSAYADECTLPRVDCDPIDDIWFCSSGDAASVELTLTNAGIAPFYYDWDVQFALLDTARNVVATTEPDADLRAINPGETVTITGNAPTGNLDSGSYDIAVRIIQPGADSANTSSWGVDVRNTYILFANDVEVIDGSWGSSGQLNGGWSILGSTQVTN